MQLNFMVEISEIGVMKYRKRFPELAHLDAVLDHSSSYAKLLIREAIAAWQWDGLVNSAEGEEVIRENNDSS